MALATETNHLPRFYFYHVYGLNCRSNTAIPGFREQLVRERDCEIVLEISSEVPKWVEDGRKLPPSVRYSQEPDAETGNPGYSLTAHGFNCIFELNYSDGARFAIGERGTQVWGMCTGSLHQQDLAVYVRGPLMGFLLRRRGTIALHASAVSVAGYAVLLCGASEAGKSTTAAALALRGIPILCDDIAALCDRDGEFFVEPGYPRICLWPDAVVQLFGHSGALPTLTPTWEKCFLALDGKQAMFESQRKPLSAIYLLSGRCKQSAAPRIEAIDMRNALLGLAQNTYMNWLLDREQRASEFDALCKLITTVPVRKVVPHSDPTRIGELRDLILQDVKDLVSRQR